MCVLLLSQTLHKDLIKFVRSKFVRSHRGYSKLPLRGVVLRTRSDFYALPMLWSWHVVMRYTFRAGGTFVRDLPQGDRLYAVDGVLTGEDV